MMKPPESGEYQQPDVTAQYLQQRNLTISRSVSKREGRESGPKPKNQKPRVLR